MKDNRKINKLHFIAMPLFLIYFLGLYWFCQLELFREVYILPDTWIDKKIPFIDWSILLYISHYPLLISAWLLNLRHNIKDFYKPFIICSIISFVIFLAVPTAISRPVGYHGGWEWLYSLLYKMDSHGNCFPSLHVSMALCAGFSFPSKNTLARTLYWVWVTLVSLSILLTKQHQFIDLIGGAALAFGVHFLIKGSRAARARKVRCSHG